MDEDLQQQLGSSDTAGQKPTAVCRREDIFSQVLLMHRKEKNSLHWARNQRRKWGRGVSNL